VIVISHITTAGKAHVWFPLHVRSTKETRNDAQRRTVENLPFSTWSRRRLPIPLLTRTVFLVVDRMSQKTVPDISPNNSLDDSL